MVREGQTQRDYDINALEKFMILAQRVDKSETLLNEIDSDLRRLRDIEFKECRANCETRSKEEAQKGHDWLKILIVLVITSILSSGALWYSSVTRVSIVENLVVKESDIVKKFILKEDLQKVINDIIRSHEKDYHIQSDGSKKIDVIK